MRIILVRGTSIVSKLIQWQTRGKWSHAALLFSDNAVIEAKEFIGVRRLPFASWMAQQDGIYKVFTVDTSPDQEARMREYAEAQVGKPYDYSGVLRFVTRQNYATQPDNAWWCSEIVFEDLKEGGIELFARTEGWEVAPSLLEKSPLMK